MVIAADLLKTGTMLATPSKDPADLIITMLAQPGIWTFDIKWDGVRCLAYLNDGVVMLRNRNGVDITHRYPDVCEHLAATFPKGEKVFDGEMLCFDPVTGRPEFARIAKRDAQSNPAKIAALAKSMPASFMVFDFLWDHGSDLRKVAQAGRHTLLKVESDTWPEDPRLMVSQWSDDGQTLWTFVNSFGMEGLIAKDKRSTYAGRRDPAWVKLKKTHRVTAIVTGYENGKGARDGKVGALLIGLLNDAGELVPVGKVGTGLKAHDHEPMLEVLKAGQEFLVEVEFLEFTPEGQLRFPSFKGVRSDVTRAACTLSQIGAL